MEGNQPYISIIMPVYNSARYLGEALSCIQNQTFEDWELLIVDDCSTDQSVALCEVFADQDDRVRVIKLTANGGPGRARNHAIDEARGTYITFVDADDQIELDMLEKAAAKAKEYQIDTVVWGMTEEYYNRQGKKVSENTLTYPETYCQNQAEVEACILPLEEKTLLGYQCNKLYRNSIIKEHQIRFEQTLIYEDFFFSMQFMEHATSMYILDEALYCYKKRINDSITASYIDGYFKLSHRKIKVLDEYCDRCSIKVQDKEQILGQLYVRYILSALMRNHIKESQMTWTEQVRWVHKVRKEHLYRKLSEHAAIKDKKLRVIQNLMNHKMYHACVLIGEIVYLTRRYMPMGFVAIKRYR